MEFTELEKNLLNAIQQDLPIAARPFAVLAEKLGASEKEVIQAIQHLKAEKVIRQISAIFDTRSLGYESSLVAAKIDPDKLDEAAALINTHPGVTHNYARNHDYNLWYTVAVPPNSILGLQKTVDLLHQLSGANVTRLMPTLKLYKIGVNFDVAGKDKPDQKTGKAAYTDANRTPDQPLTQKEMDFVLVFQQDLPITEEPYQAWSEQLGLSIEALAKIGKDLQNRGKMRRVSAVLHHRKAGFTANAMGVWVVPEDRCEELGPKMGGYRAVSHCYRRPTYEDWPYTIFTMVHGKSVKECENVIQTIAEDTGIKDYFALYSTKEFKKTRVKYFTPEMSDWEKEYAPKLNQPV